MAGIKLIIFGGGACGKINGSGERDGKNLVRMRSILSLKKSRNMLAREDASGTLEVSLRDFDDELLLLLLLLHSQLKSQSTVIVG